MTAGKMNKCLTHPKANFQSCGRLPIKYFRRVNSGVHQEWIQTTKRSELRICHPSTPTNEGWL
jgi:hypothetical protein